MSGVTIGGLLAVVCLIVVMLFGLNSLASEVADNTNLDSKSSEIITELNIKTGSTYNLSTITSLDTGNESCENVDAFFRQACKDSGTINEQKSSIEKIGSMPNFLFNITGIQLTPLFAYILGIIVFLLGIAVIFALYKGIRTGEVD